MSGFVKHALHLFGHFIFLDFWAGCADIGAAVASTMAVMITPTFASRDVTGISTSAAATVASSLTCRLWFWAGCADIRAAVASTMAVLITPTVASRDVTAIPTRSAAGSVARSLTYRLRWCSGGGWSINPVIELLEGWFKVTTFTHFRWRWILVWLCLIKDNSHAFNCVVLNMTVHEPNTRIVCYNINYRIAAGWYHNCIFTRCARINIARCCWRGNIAVSCS